MNNTSFLTVTESRLAFVVGWARKNPGILPPGSMSLFGTGKERFAEMLCNASLKVVHKGNNPKSYQPYILTAINNFNIIIISNNMKPYECKHYNFGKCMNQPIWGTPVCYLYCRYVGCPDFTPKTEKK